MGIKNEPKEENPSETQSTALPMSDQDSLNSLNVDKDTSQINIPIIDQLDSVKNSSIESGGHANHNDEISEDSANISEDSANISEDSANISDIRDNIDESCDNVDKDVQKIDPSPKECDENLQNANDASSSFPSDVQMIPNSESPNVPFHDVKLGNSSDPEDKFDQVSKYLRLSCKGSNNPRPVQKIFHCEVQNTEEEIKNESNSTIKRNETGKNSFFNPLENIFKDRTASKGVNPDNNKNCLTSLSARINEILENAFENHGRRVAKRPRLVILICLITTLVCSIGFARFYTELRPLHLWLSKDSEFLRNFNWQKDNFPDTHRYHVALWEADNVLTAEVIQEMWKVHSLIEKAKELTYGSTWQNKCTRIPSLVSSDRRRKRSPTKDLRRDFDDDHSFLFHRDYYCKELQNTTSLCLERSLLEVWGYDEQKIMSLTDQDVINDVNELTTSKVYGFRTDFKEYLGGITYDKKGDIVAASATKHIWVSEINQTAIDDGLWTFDSGTGYKVDLMGMAFEELFLETIFNATKTYDSITVHPNAASSFGKISERSIDNDTLWIILGFIFMLIFTNLTIGKRNIVELRTSLSTAGIFGILQSIVITLGLCSLFGVFYSPVNSILPVLMVGLGVDDMFVIMAAWKHVQKINPSIDLVERMALTMRQAGVAITVTSVTDVVAFAVGASTSLPALRSFCIYAAFGILSVYLMQISFFLAFVIYDERRIQDKRCDMLWCIQVPDWKPSSCSQKELLKFFISDIYCPFVLSKPVRIIVLLFSFVLLMFSLWGTSNLTQNFEHMNFLPRDSYLFKEHLAQEKYFPEDGNRAVIYFANASLPGDIPAIQNLMDDLNNLTYVSDVSDMFSKYLIFFEYHPDFKKKELNKENFKDSFSFYLNTKNGAIHKKDFHFEDTLTCHNSTPSIYSFRLGISLKDIHSPAKQIRARAQLRDMVNNANISGYRISIAKNYISWETNEIVAKELRSNMILVLIVIYCITLLLLASFWGALMVFGSVTATMTCIGGLIWAWNVPVDTVSCIGIVLSVGLSVDYAVHVVHMYLSLKGLEPIPRVKETLVRVGAAVFQGGLSTLITFLMMSPSKSHVFITFFKIFVGSAVFGLYWGLVVLPVVLSYSCKLPDFKSFYSRTKKVSQETVPNEPNSNSNK